MTKKFGIGCWNVTGGDTLIDDSFHPWRDSRIPVRGCDCLPFFIGGIAQLSIFQFRNEPEEGATGSGLKGLKESV